MISAKSEEAIRKLLREKNLSNNEIARRTKTSYKSVQSVRRMLDMVSKVTEEQMEVVVHMLSGGYPARVISEKLLLSVEIIKAIQKYNYLRTIKSNRKKSVPLCDSCKNSIDINRKPSGGGGLTSIESVLEDLLALDRLNIINSPLFCSLACRARVALENHKNGKKKNT